MSAVMNNDIQPGSDDRHASALVSCGSLKSFGFWSACDVDHEGGRITRSADANCYLTM